MIRRALRRLLRRPSPSRTFISAPTGPIRSHWFDRMAAEVNHDLPGPGYNPPAMSADSLFFNQFKPGPDFVAPGMALDNFPAEPDEPMTGPERVRAACERDRGMSAPGTPVTLCGGPPPDLRLEYAAAWLQRGVAGMANYHHHLNGPLRPDEVFVVLIHPDLLAHVEHGVTGIVHDYRRGTAWIRGHRVVPDSSRDVDDFQLAVTRPI